MNTAVQKMFNALPRRYEIVNHITTFGLDTAWRKRAAEIATRGVRTSGGGAAVTGTGAGTRPGSLVWLDVSTGTGEMAELLTRVANPGTIVLAADFSLPMLREAALKRSAAPKKSTALKEGPAPEEGAAPGKGPAPKEGAVPMKGAALKTDVAPKKSPSLNGGATPKRSTFAGKMLLVAADDCRLPLRDTCLDLVTISLGTRNLNTSRGALVTCLREFHRVLRPGGRFVNLETSQPRSRVVRTLFHAYVRGFVRPVASAVSGNKSAYSYLASTVCSFYEAEELAAIIQEAGFRQVEAKRLFFGVAAIHAATK